MRYMVRSRIRFTLFVAFSIIISVSALNLLIGTTTQVSGSSVQTYKTIEICAGDTFWTIADEYMPNDMDTRDAIHELREINGMAQTDQLIAGDPEGLQRMRHPLLHDMFREMRTRLLKPAVIVDYIREAYIMEAEEVRITFDKQIRTGLYSTDLFNPSIPTYPVFDDPLEVLEVKYDEFLPSYLQSTLSCVTAVRSAVSKYTWCRRYENKEY